MEDQKIVELFEARNEEALDACKKKYDRFCFHIADRILCCREDAEEIVNDTYLKAWNTIPPQKPQSIKDYLGNPFMEYSVEDLKGARALYNLEREDYIVVGAADADVMKIGADGKIVPIEGEEAAAKAAEAAETAEAEAAEEVADEANKAETEETAQEDTAA